MNQANLKVKSILRSTFQLILITLFFSNSLQAQDLSTENFKGHENWPLYVPGDLKVNNDKLSQLRIEFEAKELGGPGGANFRLYLDVLDVDFKGRPANWIQWTFTDPSPESTGTPNQDLLIMDRETQQLLFRLMPNGGQGQPWAGPYGFIQVMPDQIRKVNVTHAGSAKLDSLALDTPVFEFASLGFLFPFIDLYKGRGFRLKTYHFGLHTIGNMSVYVKGETKIKDTSGKSHKAWEIDVLSASGAGLVTYYVTKKAPFWYGWNYRLVKEGKVLFKMDYRGWTSTEVK